VPVVWGRELTLQRVWGVENSGDQLTRTISGRSVDVHIDNPAEELNFCKSELPVLNGYHYLHEM